MQVISHDFIYFLRAIFFGFAVGFSVFVIVYYFKPLTAKLFGLKDIDTDVWWWSGMTIAVVLGVIPILILL
ncbi:MAG: hypothetical protein PHH21_01835 [Candidatus Pacebacteria bacterium]|nr:hypothetical protein [Candidatus Paceibacterota bacterium]